MSDSYFQCSNWLLGCKSVFIAGWFKWLVAANTGAMDEWVCSFESLVANRESIMVLHEGITGFR